MRVSTRILAELSAMKRFFAYLFAAHQLAYGMVVFAYGVDTHQDLSAAAVDISILKTDLAVLPNLGLDRLAAKKGFPNFEGRVKSISELVQDGAKFVDKNIRSRRHFYDHLTI